MQIYNGRFSAKLEGDFVVFLIGMRINRLWLIHKWLPVFFAMPRMLRELARQPNLGMLHAQSFYSGKTLMIMQYWRSFDHLHAYAHTRTLHHLPAWTDFNRKVGGNGSVGIFHESYLIKAGQFECVYANMPKGGLLMAGEMVPASGGMKDARSRLRATEKGEFLSD